MASGYITRGSPLFHHKITAILFVALIVSSGIAIYEYTNNNRYGDYFGLRGTLSVYLNGKFVTSQPDVIDFAAYDYFFCRVFNDSTACQSGTLGQSYGATAQANGCRTYSSSGTINTPNRFSATTRCSLLGIALSTDSNTPIAANSGCVTSSSFSIVNSNGVVPSIATTTHASASNSISLSVTFTATGTVSNIFRACLMLWNDKNNAWVQQTASDVNELTMLADLIPNAPYTLTSGQSLGLTWTISM